MRTKSPLYFGFELISVRLAASWIVRWQMAIWCEPEFFDRRVLGLGV